MAVILSHLQWVNVFVWAYNWLAWSLLTTMNEIKNNHYNDVIMTVMLPQITSLMIVYSTVYSGADQRKHQSSTSLAFVRGIHWWPVNSSHKGPIRWKMFPFDDVVVTVEDVVIFLKSIRKRQHMDMLSVLLAFVRWIHLTGGFLS